MSAALQIPRPGERRLVRIADALLAPARWLPGRRPRAEVRRVLLLRLERIGDLLMVLDAIQDACAAWPGAEIDLAVGAWNEPLARLIPGLSGVEVATAPWLARHGESPSWTSLINRALAWRGRRYDVVVNFEPDIRSNLIAWLTGAAVRWGYSTGGGAAVLTDALAYDAAAHVSLNARRLIERAAARPMPARPESASRLVVPRDAVVQARRRLQNAVRPRIGVHVSGGRASKQWHLDRFADAARAIAVARGATIVLTGSAADRPLVNVVRQQLSDISIIDLAGQLDLIELAAVLEDLDLLVTGDTGPMHLAAAMGTPTVALFGPSNPQRFGPTGNRSAILRVDLPCSPCGFVRLPPERCRGHVPDCMDGITVERVVAAALDVLREQAAARRR
jgi:ADP-heptose:LPS heptosyltransferase